MSVMENNICHTDVAVVVVLCRQQFCVELITNRLNNPLNDCHNVDLSVSVIKDHTLLSLYQVALMIYRGQD